MKRYGRIYQVVDFIERSRSNNSIQSANAPDVLAFLKNIDDLQQGNASIDLTIQTGGELRVLFRGGLLFTVKPAHRHLRLIIGKSWNTDAEALSKALIKLERKGEGFGSTKHTGTHYQWLLDSKDIAALHKILCSLGKTKTKLEARLKMHPRTFPSEIRNAAYSEFERNGSWCPGIPGKVKKHKLNLNAGDRIEYDHLIPYSKGGTSSDINLQILCTGCNRSKSARVI